MVKIELIMDEEKQCFLNVLKKKLDELVVPLAKWDLYIKDNPRIKPDQMPEFAISGTIVDINPSTLSAMFFANGIHTSVSGSNPLLLALLAMS